MLRTYIGGCVGALVGILAVTAYGAVDGWQNGVPGRRDLAPGLETALIGGLWCGMMLGITCGAAGGVAGGLAGFGSWLVRPRKGQPVGGSTSGSTW